MPLIVDPFWILKGSSLAWFPVQATMSTRPWPAHAIAAGKAGGAIAYDPACVRRFAGRRSGLRLTSLLSKPQVQPAVSQIDARLRELLFQAGAIARERLKRLRLIERHLHANAIRVE